MTNAPTSVRFSDQHVIVTLEDNREISVPLALYPRLMEASTAQRAAFELSATGIHWDASNEDISVAGLLAGTPDMTCNVIDAETFDRLFE